MAEEDSAVPTFGGRHAATNTWAYITRNMWDDYTKRFWPQEDALFAETTYENPGLIDREVAAGQERAGRAIDTSLGIQREALQGYGVSPSRDQRTANRRTESLTRSASVVDAANRIRQRLSDRNKEIAIGSSSMSDKVAGGGG